MRDLRADVRRREREADDARTETRETRRKLNLATDDAAKARTELASTRTELAALQRLTSNQLAIGGGI